MSLNNLANRQSEVGARGDALRSIEEAVGLYRQLASSDPGAFLPNLAGSLNNLANRQAEVGARGDALRSIEEAVAHWATLTRAAPVVFAERLGEAAVARADLGPKEAARASLLSASDLVEGLARAVVLAATAQWLASAGETGAAGELLARGVPLAASDGAEPRLLGVARRALREAAQAVRVAGGEAPSDAPPWVVRELLEEEIASVDAWVSTLGDWPKERALLVEQRERYLAPTFRAALLLLRDLQPEIGSATTLLGRLDAFAQMGFEGAIALFDALHAAAVALSAWMATPSWAESRRYFEEHEAALRSEATRQTLAVWAQGDPVAAHHHALLALVDLDGVPAAFEIITDEDAAVEAAWGAVGRLDTTRLRLIVAVAFAALGPFTAAVLTAVAAGLDGKAEDARQLGAAAAQMATAAQARTTAARLRRIERTSGRPDALAPIAEALDAAVALTDAPG
jgi:hypothetical protein